MRFIDEKIHKIITSIDLSDNEKFEKIQDLIDEHVFEIRRDEYNYGKEDGFDEGYEAAKKEFERDVQNPKKTIKKLLESANYDDITLKELFREFKLQMKIKNLL
jgi:flagellar biosynthesis/type III secretory pathway protein FliH